MFRKIIVIGAGMMGSSLIWAIQHRKIAQEVKALVRKEAQIQELAAKNIKAITDYQEVKDADLVIIAANLGAYAEIIAKLNAVISEKTLVTDLGSVKSYPEELFAENYKFPKNFIGSHPIAGSEKYGCGAIIENLYSGKKVFIAATENPNCKAIEHFWRSVGMKVKYLAANIHDQIYAEISHFPQFLAFEIKAHLGEERIEYLRKIGDETLLRTLRLCDSSSGMWEEIFEYNEKAMQNICDEFAEIIKDDEFTEISELQQNLLHLKQLNLKLVNHEVESLIISLSYYYLKMLRGKKSIAFAGKGFNDFIQYFLHYSLDANSNFVG